VGRGYRVLRSRGFREDVRWFGRAVALEVAGVLGAGVIVPRVAWVPQMTVRLVTEK